MSKLDSEIVKKLAKDFLIIDILRDKFPSKKKEDVELYFDTARGRSKDFSVVLKNFSSKKNYFGMNKALVERLTSRATKLKDDANDKTHSWYHLVKTKNEIDELDIQTTLELIKKLK